MAIRKLLTPLIFLVLFTQWTTANNGLEIRSIVDLIETHRKEGLNLTFCDGSLQKARSFDWWVIIVWYLQNSLAFGFSTFKIVCWIGPKAEWNRCLIVTLGLDVELSKSIVRFFLTIRPRYFVRPQKAYHYRLLGAIQIIRDIFLALFWPPSPPCDISLVLITVF